MFNHPSETHIRWTDFLTEQFQGKGYHCHEVKELNATVLILTTNKNTDIDQNDFSIMNRSYRKTGIN
jgi:hypothetical protein